MKGLINDPAIRSTVENLLGYEALLLDEGRFEEWFELFEDEYIYFIPVRSATAEHSEQLSDTAFRVKDTKRDLRMRIDRIATGVGWAEVPPSRTMRNIGSIVIEPGGESDTYLVSSAVLTYRHRGTDKAGDWIPARRKDEVRITSDGARFVSRTVILTEVTMSTPNLGIFL